MLIERFKNIVKSNQEQNNKKTKDYEMIFMEHIGTVLIYNKGKNTINSSKIRSEILYIVQNVVLTSN